MAGVIKNLLKNIKNHYLPINILLLAIAGLYRSREIKNSVFMKIYALYRGACIFGCILLSFWIIAGLMKKGNFVLIDIAGTLLHFCKYFSAQPL